MGARNVITSETLQMYLLTDLHHKHGILKTHAANERSHVDREATSV